MIGVGVPQYPGRVIGHAGPRNCSVRLHHRSTSLQSGTRIYYFNSVFPETCDVFNPRSGQTVCTLSRCRRQSVFGGVGRSGPSSRLVTYDVSNLSIMIDIPSCQPASTTRVARWVRQIPGNSDRAGQEVLWMFIISKVVQSRSGWMRISGTPTNPDPTGPRLTRPEVHMIVGSS